MKAFIFLPILRLGVFITILELPENSVNSRIAKLFHPSA